jgi:type I restriction enzyme S subunit
VKDGWIACPLANFVTARPGNNKIIKGKESDRPSAALVQGFSASGPDVWVKTADYEQDGVVVSAVGARCGKTFLAQGKWTAIANTHVLLPGPEIDHRWLWYRTNDETFWSRGGTAQPFVKIKETLLRECEIPPLAEQRRIVAILDEAFEGIAVAKANAERKLESAREIFEVRREQVLSKDDSDWSVAPLRELCDIRHGYPFEGEFFAVEGEFVLLTPGNFHEAGGYRDRGPKQKFFVGEIPTDYVLSRGDLLVAMTEQAAGLLGSPLLVPESARFLHNQRLGRIVPRPGAVWANEFFFHVFNLRRVRGEIHASASGVKVRHTSPGKIGDVCVAYPNSLEAQRRVASRLFEFEDESDRLIACVRKKVSALDELKKSLLHQAFAGAL